MANEKGDNTPRASSEEEETVDDEQSTKNSRRRNSTPPGVAAVRRHSLSLARSLSTLSKLPAFTPTHSLPSISR